MYQIYIIYYTILSNIIEVEKGVFKETRREVAIVERGNQGLDGNEQMATTGPKGKSPPFFLQNSCQPILYYQIKSNRHLFVKILFNQSNIKFISCFFVKYFWRIFSVKGEDPPNRPKVVRQQKFPRSLAEEQKMAKSTNKDK